MVTAPTRVDYDWADPYHTHQRRRAAILKKYPQIRGLMRYDPNFKWRVLLIVAIQFVSYFVLAHVELSIWVWALFGYFFTGVLNHSLSTAIHDICHNQAFGNDWPLANRLFGMVASAPLGIPTSVPFWKFHKDHHAFLGQVADTDLPSEWEGRFFNTTPRKILWLLAQPAFFGLRPFLVTPKPFLAIEAVGLVVQFTVDYAIYQYCGLSMLIYMFAATLIGTGLHPVAAHLLTEHYVFFHEQDYLNKLRNHPMSQKLLVPDTFSYYGPLNWLLFNVGYHVEHHDFPSIPSSLLPKVREIAPEYYMPLCYHTSLTKCLFRYIFDARMNPFARIRRRELFIETMADVKRKANEQISLEQKMYEEGSYGTNIDRPDEIETLIEKGEKSDKRDQKLQNNKVVKRVKPLIKIPSMLENKNQLIKEHYIFYQ